MLGNLSLSTLYKYFDDSNLDNIAINDSSYNVMTTALSITSQKSQAIVRTKKI